MTNLVRKIPPASAGAIIDVFCDAFRSYPVMSYVVGPHDADRRLHRLIELFVMRRLKYAPAFGVLEDDELVAAATMTLPGEAPAPADIVALGDAVWDDLGDEARQRYDHYRAVTQAFADSRPHHHLNMIGVRHAHMGRGLARPILDAVAQLAQDDPQSAGVSLTTEVRRNLSLYEHFGYRVVGHARVSPELETWGLFRDKERT